MTTDYERWFFTAKDAETGLPLGTHLLHQACDNDPARFEIAERIVQAAFEAAAGDRYAEAKALVFGAGKASASFIQRRLYIGGQRSREVP